MQNEVFVNDPPSYLETLTPLVHPEPLIDTTSAPYQGGYASVGAYAARCTSLAELEAWLNTAEINLFQLAALRVSALRSLSNEQVRGRMSPEEARQLEFARRAVDRHLNLTSGTGETYHRAKSLNPIPPPGQMRKPAGPLAETWLALAAVKITARMTTEERRRLLWQLMAYVQAALLTEVGADPTAEQGPIIERLVALSVSVSSTTGPRHIDVEEISDTMLRDITVAAIQQLLRRLRG